MLELGDISSEEHYKLGKELLNYGVDLIFAFGKHSKMTVEGALESGFAPECVFYFECDKMTEGRAEIESSSRDGDIILYKASRGIGLERLIE